MNVLSIDFDFFQDAEVEQLHRYPDGIDYGTKISIVVWSHYYTQKSLSEYMDVKAIKINRKFFKQMKEIIVAQDETTPVLIVNSHKHIYDFIHEYWNGKDKCDVWNVDMHHDIFNDNDKLDCGNWGMHIINDGARLHWIGRQMSIEAYGLGKVKDFPMEQDFEKIKNKEFDLIFLCRSDTWLPPHLDRYFVEMAKLCCDHFDRVCGDPDVLVSRMKEISKQVKSYDEMERQCHMLSMLQKGRDDEETVKAIVREYNDSKRAHSRNVSGKQRNTKDTGGTDKGKSGS